MARKNSSKKVRGTRKIRNKDLPLFTRQLAAMLDAGIPLVQTLNAMEEQIENKNFKPVVEKIRKDVEGGSTYSDALAEYPAVFSELYVSMMKAGESGGMLAETCGRVASFLEAANRLRSKVKSAMMYPSIVLIVALLIASFLVVFVVPKFASMFSGFGGELPKATQILMDISTFVRTYWYIVIGAITTLVYAFKRYKNTEKGAYKLDRLKIKFPILGELARKLSLARFSSTFAQLMHSGVPILQTLDIVGVATGNKYIGQMILDSKPVVEQGGSLSSALEGNPEFPRMLVHMLSAGEKTGNIEGMLGKIGKFYQEDVDDMLEGLTSMLEPLLMVFIGLIIGSIVFAMFMPIFKMSSMVG